MELASVQTPAAALLAGVVTSLHCAGMCGPLACWLNPVKAEEDGTTIAAVYHVSRIFGYGALGLIAGALGQMPLALVDGPVLRFLPWVLVLFFLAVATGWDKRLPRPLFLARLSLKLQGWIRGRSRTTVALALGVATPVLPCGPLYFLLALSALSGSALRGAEFMLAFGLGTVPLLWFFQANFGWLRLRVNPATLKRLQASLALAAAFVVAWRLRSTLGFHGPGINDWICF